MSGKPWDKAVAAKALDARTNADLSKVDLASPSDFFKELRLYLQRTTDTGRDGPETVFTCSRAEHWITATRRSMRAPPSFAIHAIDVSDSPRARSFHSESPYAPWVARRRFCHIAFTFTCFRAAVSIFCGSISTLRRKSMILSTNLDRICILVLKAFTSRFRLWGRWKCWIVSFT